MTIDSLIDELESARSIAENAEQASAAVAATMAKAKLLGLVSYKAESRHTVQGEDKPDLATLMINAGLTGTNAAQSEEGETKH